MNILCRRFLFLLLSTILTSCSKQPAATKLPFGTLALGMTVDEAVAEVSKEYNTTDSIIFYRGQKLEELKKQEIEVYIRRFAPIKIGNQYGILNLFFDSTKKLSQIHWVRFPFYNALCTIFEYKRSNDPVGVDFMQQQPTHADYQALGVYLNNEIFLDDPLSETEVNKFSSKDQSKKLEFRPSTNSITFSVMGKNNGDLFERYYWVNRPMDTSSVLSGIEVGTPKKEIEKRFTLRDTILHTISDDNPAFVTQLNCFGFDGPAFFRFDSLDRMILFNWYYRCNGNGPYTEYAFVKCLTEVERYFPSKMDLYPPDQSGIDNIMYFATPSSIMFYMYRPALLITLAIMDTKAFPQPDFLKIHQ